MTLVFTPTAEAQFDHQMAYSRACFGEATATKTFARIEGFLGNFTGLARRLIAVPVPGVDKAVTAPALADIARKLDLSATSRDTLDEAFDAVRKLDLDPPPRILITGSLYLAGEVLRENGTLPT